MRLHVRTVSPYTGRMSGNGDTNASVNKCDWIEMEADFMESPLENLVQFAERRGVSYSTVIARAQPDRGDWIHRRNERYRAIHHIAAERIAGIVAESRENDISAFKALEDRLKSVVFKSLELLFPPDDAPLEAMIAATNRLKAMTATQLSVIINSGMRTLTETGRHRRLLTGQSTAIFARAEAPDILLPIPLEEAKALEMRSRMAQIALTSAAEGSPLDVDFAVLESPENTPEPVSVGGSPTIRRHGFAR